MTPIGAVLADGLGPCVLGDARPVPALEWHEDSFDLPDGAVLLAQSPAYRHQAFRWGACAYGLQFHLELSPAHVSRWKRNPGFGDLLRRLPLSGAELLATVRAHQGRMKHLSHALFRRWVGLLEAA